MTKRNRKHEVQSSEVQSSEAQSSEAQSSEAQSSEAQSSEVQSSEAQSSEAQSSEAQSSEAQSSEAQSSEAQSSEAQSSEVQSSEVQSSEVQSSEAQSSEAQSEVTDAERQITDLRNTFIKSHAHVKSNNKKSTWKDVVEKAAINAAKRNFQFRKDSNRDVIYQLLQNDFVTLNDCRLACKNVNRTLISLYTDLHDVANLTKRKLISEKRNNVMYYKLAERIAQVA